MEEAKEQSGVKEVKKGAGAGLIVAALCLMGLIYTNGQKFSSNEYYGIPLLIVAIGAAWLHYKTRFIKNSLWRWIVLFLGSGFVLGLASVLFK